MGPIQITLLILGVSLVVAIVAFLAGTMYRTKVAEREYEKEVKERRSELSKQERRLQQKEESLDKKMDAYERKEEDLAK